MTERAVALFRGINVGRAKRVAMADLRALFEDLGYTGVRTLLNSGNVVFATSGRVPRTAGARIEEAVAARLGVESRVVVVRARELADVVAENPLADEARDPSRHLVVFLADPADRERLLPLATRSWAPESLALGSRSAYLWSPDGVLASRALVELQRALGDRMTTRNWATVLKLNAAAARP